LNEHVDPALNLTFKLVYLNFDATYEAVEHMDRGANTHQPLIDMVFTNPSVYACLEREQGAAPVASLLNQRKVGDDTYLMDKFYGTFIVRGDSDITRIDQIEGKIVEAVSLVGLGACQLQWNELVDRGISFMSAPKQVSSTQMIFDTSRRDQVRCRVAGCVAAVCVAPVSRVTHTHIRRFGSPATRRRLSRTSSTATPTWA